MRAEAPVEITKRFLQRDIFNSHPNVKRCPAILDELQNLYGILPYYDYRLEVGKANAFFSKDYDQDFFNQHVEIQGVPPASLIRWLDNHIFFAPYEKSLVMSQVSPYLEEANKNITLMNGRFDIGKYFRQISVQFYFNKPMEGDSFVIDSEVPLYYLRFHTERPIVFKQFYVSFELSKFYKHIIESNTFPLKRGKRLSDFYDMWSKFGIIYKIIRMIEHE